MSVGRHSAASAAATVTSAQSCYWLPTILAPCSQISELALGYTVAMVRGLSAYGEKNEIKENGEDFCTVALTLCPPEPLATDSCFSL